MQIKKTLFAIIICLVLMSSISFLVSAQDDEPLVSLRLICIDTIGCLHTTLDDDALDAQFGADLERFEAGGDFSPIGVWGVFFDQETICAGEPDRDLMERMKLITAIDDSLDVNVQDDFGLTNSRYTRLGEDVYAGRDVFADSTTFNEFIEYLIMLDETSIQVLRIGVSLTGDERQPIATQVCFLYLSAQ